MQQRVGEAKSRAGFGLAAAQELRAMRLQGGDGLHQSVEPTLAQQHAGTARLEFLRCIGDELLSYHRVRNHDKTRIGAKLARTQRAGSEELVGDRPAPLLQGALHHDDRVHTRHLQIDRLSRLVGGGLEFQTRHLAARETRRPHQRMRNQFTTHLGRHAIQHLHRRRMQTCFPDRFKGDLRQQSGRAGMRGVCLGDHRIVRGDGGGKIPARHRVEGKWKVVRTEHHDRPAQWREVRMNVAFFVMHRLAP